MEYPWGNGQEERDTVKMLHSLEEETDAATQGR